MKQLILIILLLNSLVSPGQDSITQKKKLSVSGYVKDLQWVRFNKDFTSAYTTNLLHNRITIKWESFSKLTGRLEMRNRFYWGDDVKHISNFKDQLENNNEAIDLAITWYSSPSTVLHSNLERLWLEYRASRWNVRAGRQRINWGINNTWNPNDLFNAYNFLDFDYEERPGSDAAKAQYLLTDLSHIEVAAAGTQDQPIVAAKWATNYKAYDWQAIIGSYQGVFTAGLGWAGSIGDMGFKGETQYYGATTDSSRQLNVAVEADYLFGKGWYIATGFLFNQKGLHKPLTDWTKLQFRTTPRHLMPTRWNILAHTSKEFTPLFNGTVAIVYAPTINLLILFPSFRYNIKSNLDLDLVWQSFFMKLNRFQAVSHTGFLRLKYSF